MHSEDESSPAFPSDSHQYGPVIGMSMREYFAAKAMQAMLTKYGHQKDSLQELAENSFAVADAMISELSK
jgi:hypothetical protein